jgi:signal transduction histidine kinase
MAVLASGFALVLTHWINPAVKSPVYDLFQGAVVFSAWYGGLGPGLLASAVSILALDYYFIPPLHSFDLGLADLLRLVVFGAVAVLTSYLSVRLRKARSDLKRVYDEKDVEREILETTNREQRRIGQDLHDGLCQTLSGVRLLSHALREKLASGDRPEVKDIDVIESHLSEALSQADLVARGLYPVELETNGLMSALREQARKISQVYSVNCRFKCRRPVLILQADAALHLYRIALEAVMNAIKNGKAKRIILRLSEAGGQVTLRVMDDGSGFEPSAPRKGMGLRIMNYRAGLINASLDFRSRRRGCTLVTCRLASPVSSEVLDAK